MKKNQSKNKPSQRTKIQLKIKSKNVTNNFILTSRTALTSQHRSIAQKNNESIYDSRNQKSKKQQISFNKKQQILANYKNIKGEMQIINTDHIKYVTNKKKNQINHLIGVGTLNKKLSSVSDDGIRKKSQQSLWNTQKIKSKKQSISSISNHTNSYNEKILHKVLSAIIDDFKDGKINDQQLKDTLVQLCQNKNKNISGKHKNKLNNQFDDFSQQLQQSQQVSKSKTIKKSYSKNNNFQLCQKVLQLDGFVNKIIFKGLATSMFLKQDIQGSNIEINKNEQQKKICYSFNFQTQKSIRQINEDIKFIKQIYNNKIAQIQSLSKQNLMARKIQRAWKRYKTRKIINKKISNSIEAIINDKYVTSCQNQIDENIIKFIEKSLQQTTSKQQSLNKILQIIKQKRNIQSISINSPLFNKRQQQFKNNNKFQQISQAQSNQFDQQNQIKIKQNLHSLQDDNQSLTFTHSQRFRQSIKSTNINNISQALDIQIESLNQQKDKQINDLSQKYLNNLIVKNIYQTQRQKIQKWYNKQIKDVKKLRTLLTKTCNQAQKILQPLNIKKQKQNKIFKCLSDKILNKNVKFELKQQDKKQQVLSIKKILCEQSQNIQEFNQQNQQKEQKLFQQYGIIINSRNKQKQNLEISPRLIRHTSLDDQTQTQYEQLQKSLVQINESGLFDQQIQNSQKFQIQSEKYIQNLTQQQQIYDDLQVSLVNNAMNDITRKFKYLTAQDKQDIFQFMFLDLVIQIWSQQQVGSYRVKKSIANFISKLRRMKKIPKGIKTNILSSKQYLKNLALFVKQYGNLQNMSCSMGPNALQMLKYMREQYPQNQDDDSNIITTFVLPIEYFQKVNKLPALQPVIQKYYDNQQQQMARVAFLKGVLQIHHKSLFDAINEMLDKQRPYGVWGKPFPWKKTLAIDRKWTKLQQQYKFKVGIQRTIQCCSYLCGIMVDKQDNLFAGHKVSQEYINQLRQDRLSKMLANELLQSQERWVFYDDEQTQVMIEISNFVVNKLIKQFVLDLSKINLRI